MSIGDGDWLTRLTPAERRQWDEFVSHCEEELYPKLDSSAFVMSLCPTDGKPDVKFSVELGMSIMLDKPIVAVVMPGVPMPKKLEMVADHILVVDIRTPSGQRMLTEAISDIMKELSDKENEKGD